MTQQQRENLLAWCEALKSGRYKQGSGFLRRWDLYCPLGIAAELAGENWISDYEGVYSISNGNKYLPYYILNYYGITEEQQTSISQLNDRHNFTFEEIAEQIHQNILI